MERQAPKTCHGDGCTIPRKQTSCTHLRWEGGERPHTDASTKVDATVVERAKHQRNATRTRYTIPLRKQGTCVSRLSQNGGAHARITSKGRQQGSTC
eukprot:2407702-Amphidinium_carterae.3